MNKQLVLVTLLAVFCTAPVVAFRGRCNTGSCAKPKAACAKTGCVDTVCTKEIVNVPATQEVTRCVRTETKVGPIQCESCNCEEQHRPVGPDGGYANAGCAK